MADVKMPFDRIEDTQRPYRLWNEREKKHMPGRNYSDEVRAINAAWVLMYWAAVGDSITVYDVRTARFIRQFTRRVNGVADYDPKKDAQRRAA